MLPERPFQYVPAAVTSGIPNQFIGVVYEDNRQHSFLWKRTRFDGLTVDRYPDRTLYTGASLYRTSSIPDVTYDETMVTGYATSMRSLEQMGYRYAMASPHHVTSATQVARNPHVKLFSDSGGFQLFTGVVDFIDPEELADYYNRTIDYGIGLDIPVVMFNDLLDRMLQLMIKNNRVIRKNLKSSVELYEVSHGTSLKLRSSFLTGLLKEKELSSSLAIGGIAQNTRDGGAKTTTVTGTVNLVYTLLKTKGVFKRYHVLGTTSAFFQVLYWVLLSHDVAPHITADSTTYVLAPSNNMMLNSKHHTLQLSSVDTPKYQRTLSLHCSCTVCSMVKYPLAYSRFPSLSAFHSLCVIADNVACIEEATREYLAGTLTVNKLSQMLTNDTVMARIYAHCLEFARDASTKGFKTAFEKHEHALRPYLRGRHSASLFGEQTVRLTEDQVKIRTRLDQVLTRYEQYHAPTKRRTA